MRKIEQQVKYIEYEIEKYQTAYNINLNKLYGGDNSVVLVLALINDSLLNLKSIKISLETLRNDNGNQGDH